MVRYIFTDSLKRNVLTYIFFSKKRFRLKHTLRYSSSICKGSISFRSDGSLHKKDKYFKPFEWLVIEHSQHTFCQTDR